jgi:hypothetical protein
MMNKKFVLVMSGGLLAFALGLGLFLKGRNAGSSFETTEGLTTKAKTNADMAPIVEKSLNAVTEGKTLDQALSTEEYNSLREELKRSDPMYLERKILARNERLAEFRRLHLKLVKKADDEAAYKAMLRDARALTEATAALNRERADFSPEDQIERMIYVDWLSEAITASRGQDAKALHQELANIIRADLVFDRSKSVELRKSQYVDRMEIFRSYARVYPQEALSLLEGIRESKYKKQLMDIVEKAQS